VSNQKTNSVLVFVAVLVAAIIVIYAIISRKPTTSPPADSLTPANATDGGSDTGGNSANPDPDDGVTLIDQTTDTTQGEVPAGGGDASNEDPPDDDGEGEPGTPAVPSTLIEAAQVGDVTVMHAMIDSGMDVNGTDDGGRTPLMHAAGGGHLDAVFVLLNEGADASLRDNARRSARDYALARADESGQTITRILEDAVGPPPIQDAGEK
jgi:hypothetical protein